MLNRKRRRKIEAARDVCRVATDAMVCDHNCAETLPDGMLDFCLRTYLTWWRLAGSGTNKEPYGSKLPG
jgi:hypothetical protein